MACRSNPSHEPGRIDGRHGGAGSEDIQARPISVARPDEPRGVTGGFQHPVCARPSPPGCAGCFEMTFGACDDLWGVAIRLRWWAAGADWRAYGYHFFVHERWQLAKETARVSVADRLVQLAAVAFDRLSQAYGWASSRSH